MIHWYENAKDGALGGGLLEYDTATNWLLLNEGSGSDEGPNAYVYSDGDVFTVDGSPSTLSIFEKELVRAGTRIGVTNYGSTSSTPIFALS